MQDSKDSRIPQQLPPDATPISTEQLLMKIGELTVLSDVLRQRIKLLQDELEEHAKDAPYSEPVRVPQRQPDYPNSSERM